MCLSTGQLACLIPFIRAWRFWTSDDTQLRLAFSILEGRAALQRALGWRQIWVKRSLYILQKGQMPSNACGKEEPLAMREAGDWLPGKHLCPKRTWGKQSEYEPAAHWQQRQPAASHRSQDRTLGKAVITFQMWSNTSWVTLALGPTTQEKCWQAGTNSEEGCKTVRAGGLALWGEAEEIGPVQPGDTMALVGHKAASQYPWEGLLRNWTRLFSEVHPGQGANWMRIGSGLMWGCHYEDYLNNCPRRL